MSSTWSNRSLSPLTDPVWTTVAERTWGKTTRVSRASLRRTKTSKSEREAIVGGQGSPIPIIYGRVKVGGVIVFARVKGSVLHLVSVWGEGEIDGVEKVELDRKDAIELSGVAVQHFNGSADQTCPASLTAAFPDYSDDLPHIAYSYIRISGNGDITSIPQVAGVVRGIKVFDPGSGAVSYSSNPALCLADFLCSERYGRGKGPEAIDWYSVSNAADDCDEQVNGKPRRSLGLALQTNRESRQWQETLRAYANVMLYEDEGRVHMTPDSPRSVDHDFEDDVIAADSLTLFVKPESELPDVVEVVWTDPDGDWRDATVRKVTGDAVRLSRFHLPGITDVSEAERAALELLNRAVLATRIIRFTTQSYGLLVTPGDVIRVTHGGWLPETLFRVLTCRHAGTGQWRIEAEAYDEAVYSNAIAPPLDWSEPELADPMNPPAPTGLQVNEVVYQLQTGVYATRLEASWDDMSVDYPFAAHYLVSAEGIGLVHPLTPIHSNTWVSPALQEGVSYTFTVRLASPTGAVSVAAAASVEAQGKQLPPGDVPAIYEALEGAGWVLLRWRDAVDLDIVGYEIRRGAVSDDWEGADFLARVDATSYLDNRVPEGTHRYFVKALDSVGNYSTNAVFTDVEVSAYGYEFVGKNHWRAGDFNLTMMHAFYVRGQGWFLVPDDDEDFANGASGTLESWADNPLCLGRNSYGGAIAESTSWDLLLQKGGQWTAGGLVFSTFEANMDAATIKKEIRLSPDDSNWDDHDGLNVIGTGRYARICITDECTGPDASFTVWIKPATMECHAEERTEEGMVSVPAGASQPQSVTLSGSYSSVKSLVLTAEGDGTKALIPLAANVDATGFNIYVFDKDDNKVAGTVRWQFKGA